MRNLEDVLKDIEKLQREADKLRQTERKAVIQRILLGIQEYAITPEELGFGVKPVKPVNKPIQRAAKAKLKPLKGKRPPKYQNPNNPAQTWSGMGRKPQWLVDSLQDSTRSLESLEVKPQ